MLCESCNFDNGANARFCISCGAGLGLTCPACGHGNPLGGRFCAQCGTALGERAAKKYNEEPV